jgi:hypothetical protein
MESFNTSDPGRAVGGRCYFRKNVSSHMIQLLSRSNYSLLINAGLAYYNLSAYMGCTLPNRSSDSVFVDMRCWNEYFDGAVCARLSRGDTTGRFFSFLFSTFYFVAGMNKNVSGFQYQSVVGPVPKGNAHFRVWIETEIRAPTQPTDPIAQICFIDDVKLFIFKKEN